MAVLVFSLLLRAVSLPATLTMFKTLGGRPLVFAVLLLAPNIFIQTWKWRYILNLSKPGIAFTSCLRSLLIGYPLGFVTPGRIGEIGRAFFIPEIPKKATVTLAVFDKLTNLVATLFIGAGALLYLVPNGISASLMWCLTTLTAGLLAFVLATCTLATVRKRLRRLLQLPRLTAQNMLTVWTMALLFNLTFLSQLFALTRNHTNVDALSIFAAAAAAMAAKTVLPLALADLGIRESAIVYFFHKVGIGEALAFTAGFVLFFINVGLPALVGLAVLLKIRRQGTNTERTAS